MQYREQMSAIPKNRVRLNETKRVLRRTLLRWHEMQVSGTAFISHSVKITLAPKSESQRAGQLDPL